MPQTSYLPHSHTHSFSKLITDYLAGVAQQEPFYQFRPSDSGLDAAIAQRSQYPVDREVLHTVVSEQYKALPHEDAVQANIASLVSASTYTVCTAHQPNILTGYLYTIYKILHTVKLCSHLKARHPALHFVPIFYIGSEDNDLEELGQFYYDHKKYIWDGAGQSGAVGSMHAKGFDTIWSELYRHLGPPSAALQELKEVLQIAYSPKHTIADATRILVHALLGAYGVVCIDPDDTRLKQAYKDIMWSDLTEHVPAELVGVQSSKLAQEYKTQAYVRPINLFYLLDGLRERIEQEGDRWQVVNTDISFSKAQLRDELEAHPERFSPNVILRGMYQESILPNVAFIGGGSELAYFFQLKEMFATYKVFFPPLILRQSLSLLLPADQALQQRLELSDAALFVAVADLLHQKMERGQDQTLSAELEQLELMERQVRQKAKKMDQTLVASAAAHLARMRKQLLRLDHKLYKAMKRQNSTLEHRLTEMHEAVFPSGHLQERHENFLSYYLLYPDTFFATILAAIKPYGQEYGIVKF